MDVMNHYLNVGIQYVKYLIHTFCVYVFVLCVLVVLVRHWALKRSRSLTAQGYMLDWLGDVTSTVSFCQLSGSVCYPTNLCINCMLCMDLHQTYKVCNYAFGIVFE